MKDPNRAVTIILHPKVAKELRNAIKNHVESLMLIAAVSEDPTPQEVTNQIAACNTALYELERVL